MKIFRATTHTLAGVLAKDDDVPIGGTFFGRFTILWDDNSKKAKQTTIKTSDIFGDDD